ncbi:MAG: hypothetical protein H0T51_01155 [Pirellulales bacterium]|nr:hypothetical protein [Pirellulales bacterium]
MKARYRYAFYFSVTAGLVWLLYLLMTLPANGPDMASLAYLIEGAIVTPPILIVAGVVGGVIGRRREEHDFPLDW